MGIEPSVAFAIGTERIVRAACVETGKAETILLVEDEAFVRKAAAEVLASAGYSLLIAQSAAEALERYRRCSQSIDLLLTDVVLPGMSGRELAAEFKRECPGTRILLMSGYTDQLVLCQSSSGCNYLGKPFSTSVLLKEVRQALDRVD